MITIVTVDALRFSLAGIQYWKNFLSSVSGNNVQIYNAYDSRNIIVEYTHYSQIQVNGVTYSSAALLQAALLPVLYTRDNLGSTIVDIPYFNKFEDVAGYTLAGNNLTMLSGWNWLINGLPYENVSDVLINIPFAASGKSRIDLIYANTSNTFFRIAGVESTSTPVAPTLPANTLQATFLTVTDDSISAPLNPNTPLYLGQFSSELQFLSQIPRPVYGHFAFIKNENENILCQYNGIDWDYTVLSKRRFKANLSQAGTSNVQTITSGALTVGVSYEITDYNTGDDFTNVGAPSNALAVKFIATGTTPANFSNSSELTYNQGAPVAKIFDCPKGMTPFFQMNSKGSYNFYPQGIEYTAEDMVIRIGTPSIQTYNAGAIYTNPNGDSPSPIEIRTTLPDTNPENDYLYHTLFEVEFN